MLPALPYRGETDAIGLVGAALQEKKVAELKHLRQKNLISYTSTMQKEMYFLNGFTGSCSKF